MNELGQDEGVFLSACESVCSKAWSLVAGVIRIKKFYLLSLIKTNRV